MSVMSVLQRHIWLELHISCQDPCMPHLDWYRRDPWYFIVLLNLWTIIISSLMP